MRSLAPLLALVGHVGLACHAPPKDPPSARAEGATEGATESPSASAPGSAKASALGSAKASALGSAKASAPGSAKASAPGSAKVAALGNATVCNSDADCRAFSSYCAEAPCACRALAKIDADPKCPGSGPKVSCFADPCMKKSAGCQNGACVLTAKGPAAASEK